MRIRGQGHLVSRIGWLRAAVLGANDGIISTASLIVGIATAETGTETVLLTGVAALVAGAISMAAGEYVSVSSQADLEAADRAREEKEQREQPAAEREELAAIYRERGLDPPLARRVAEELMMRDPVGSHLRDELGFSEETAARPIEAAMASAACFCAGAIVPVLMAALVPRGSLVVAVAVATLLLLAILGGIGARAGGANMVRGAARVTFWGALAMAATAAIGALFGTSV